MADEHIDPWETLSYGEFALAQIVAMLMGLAPDLDPALVAMSRRLKTATDAMRVVVAEADGHEGVTYKSSEDEAGTVASARDTLRRVVRYAESRDDGAK